MKPIYLIILTFAVSLICLPAEKPAVKEPLPEKMSEQDIRSFLSLQLQLSQAREAREKGRADLLAADRAASEIEAKLTVEITRIQTSNQCPKCDVDKDYKWIRPKPAPPDTSTKK